MSGVGSPRLELRKILGTSARFMWFLRCVWLWVLVLAFVLVVVRWWNGDRGGGRIEFVDRRQSREIGRQVQGDDVAVEIGYHFNRPSEPRLACHNK